MKYKYTYISTDFYIYIYIHTYLYIYIYVYTYTHTPEVRADFPPAILKLATISEFFEDAGSVGGEYSAPPPQYF